MITSKQYDHMCALLDNYRDAVVALQTAAPEDVVTAAYQFAEADREVHTALHALVDLDGIAKEAAERAGWIEWGGGDCPVAAGTCTEVRFDDGETSKDRSPETWAWWHNQGEGNNIIAYRVVSE